MTLLKRTPTYDLNTIKKAFDCPENLVMTSSAKRGQIELNFSDHDVVAAIQRSSPKFAVNSHLSGPSSWLFNLPFCLFQ